VGITLRVPDIDLPPLAQQRAHLKHRNQGGLRRRLRGGNMECDSFLKNKARRCSNKERLDIFPLYCNRIRAELSGPGLLYKARRGPAGALSQLSRTHQTLETLPLGEIIITQSFVCPIVNNFTHNQD
jgi:hypothetical protein